MWQLILGALGFCAALYWMIKAAYRTFGYLFPHKMGWFYFQDALATWCKLRKDLSRLDDATGVRWNSDDLAEGYKRNCDSQSLRSAYRELFQRAIQREAEIEEHNARLSSQTQSHSST